MRAKRIRRTTTLPLVFCVLSCLLSLTDHLVAREGSLPGERVQQSSPSFPEANINEVIKKIDKLSEESQTLWRNSKIRDSISPLDEAIHLARNYVPNTSRLAALLIQRGIIARNSDGDGERSEQLFSESLQIMEIIYHPDHPSTTTAMFYLAEQQANRGRRDKAEALLRRSEAILREAGAGYRFELSNTLNRLGMMMRDWRRPLDAVDLFRESMTLRAEGGIAGVISSLGPASEAAHAFIDADRLDDAALFIAELKPILQEAWNKATEGMKGRWGLPQREIDILLAEARLEQKRKNYNNASDISKRALTIGERYYGVNSIDLLSTMEMIHSVAAAEGRWKDALNAAERQLSISAEAWPRTSMRFSGLLRQRAIAEYRLGQHQAARNSLSEALDIVTLPHNAVLFASKNSLFVDVANVHLQAFNSAAESDRIALFAKAFEAVQWRLRTRTALAVAQATARMTSSNGMVSQSARERERLISAVNEIDETLVAELSKQTGERDDTSIAGLRTTKQSFLADIAQHSDNISRLSPEFAALVLPRVATIDEVQQKLEPGSAVMLLTDSEPGLMLLVEKSSYAWRNLTDMRFFRQAVRRIRCSVTDEAACVDAAIGGLSAAQRMLLAFDKRAPPFPFDDAHTLYSGLLGPHGEEIVKRVKRLYVVSDGIFSTLPLSILLSSPAANAVSDMERLKTAPWLARSHDIIHLPSLSGFIANHSQVPPSAGDRAFLGVGDPSIGKIPPLECGGGGTQTGVPGGGTALSPAPSTNQDTSLFKPGGGSLADLEAFQSLASLPESRCELLELSKRLQSRSEDILTRDQATESNIKALSEQAELRRFRVLAFATHGLAAGELGRAQPSLVLSPPARNRAEIEHDDGFLSMSEIVNLDLDADWVILSACNTASAEHANGESFSGLARAFFYAGARSLLLSHWPVYSHAAVELTTRTVAGVKADDYGGKAAALRTAMVSIIDGATDERTAHPSYWAPFSFVAARP
ncbi:CHAT domain-containing tetratricopeptide repeat protein [Bosea sp. NPDC003192]|uniref:CHAT domain-containing tetratricopeptide repeat protein n=1 Tax=Bosea sp. NPDC003192 TaxID=3390551 RepID=UPI003CFC65A7